MSYNLPDLRGTDTQPLARRQTRLMRLSINTSNEISFRRQLRNAAAQGLQTAARSRHLRQRSPQSPLTSPVCGFRARCRLAVERTQDPHTRTAIDKY